jgi:hypothetical protein
VSENFTVHRLGEEKRREKRREKGPGSIKVAIRPAMHRLLMPLRPVCVVREIRKSEMEKWGQSLRYPHKIGLDGEAARTGSAGFQPASHAGGSMPSACDLRRWSQGITYKRHWRAGPEPVGGFSGDYVWGTVIGGLHSPSTVSQLTQTFDLTGFTRVSLNFYEWIDSGGNNFDVASVLVNGNEEYISDGGPTAWRLVNVDLGVYDGLSSVVVDFTFSSTGVVERVGWYLDDVSLTGDHVVVPIPATLALLGVGLVAIGFQRRRQST